MTAGKQDRTPHSIEAEEGLLASCLLDGADVIPRARDGGISSRSFYDSKHGIVFDVLCRLLDSGKPTEIANVAEELKATRQLDQIGGYPFLTQISSGIPTTAQASYFIEKVRDHALRREMIHAATAVIEDCHAFNGGIDEFIVAAESRIRAIGNRVPARTHEMSLDSLLSFSSNDDVDCLMGRRFLCRTGGAVIVAPSGVGKSVLAVQLAACAALGRPFFGLQMRCPMRVLYVQAEDDLGDVAEAAQGFVATHNLGAEELASLRQRLRIVRWNDASGEKFLSRLRRECAKNPFDLVIVNPLFSFCGCNVSEQKEMSGFLRNGLNPVLNEIGAAAVIVHHTNKPKEDTKAVSADEERRYLGSGSAELTNWARGYITLQAVRSAGGKVYKMAFAKRGHRADIVDSDGKPTTSVFIEHSGKGLCWLPSDYSSSKSADGKFQPKFDLPRARMYYDENLSWKENERVIAEDQGVSTRTVRSHRRMLETAA